MNLNTKQNRAARQLAALSSSLKLCLTGTALVWGLAASAQTATTTTNFTVDAMVPDADAAGLANVQTVSTPVTNLTGLKVALKISGSWSGDLYCFLTHNSGHSVLLNRLGRSSASDLGYNDPGLDVNFDDAATNDIHIYRLQLGGSQGTPLTGDWAPDARVASPTNVLDTDVRSAILGSFNGVDPNGEWVLFVADMEAGDIHRLDSWSLEITGDTAPAGLAATEAAGRGELVDIKTPANHSSYLTVATSGTAPNDLNVNNLTN